MKGEGCGQAAPKLRYQRFALQMPTAKPILSITRFELSSFSARRLHVRHAFDEAIGMLAE
jgi:hypothetical protein